MDDRCFQQDPLAVLLSVHASGVRVGPIPHRLCSLATPLLISRTLNDQKGVGGASTCADVSNALFEARVMSRNHAKLSYAFDAVLREYRFALMDNNSSNGTYLNDERLESQLCVRVYSGDVLRFGMDVTTGADAVTTHRCVTVKLLLFDHLGQLHPARADNAQPDEGFCERWAADTVQLRLELVLAHAGEVQRALEARIRELESVCDEMSDECDRIWTASVSEDALLMRIAELERTADGQQAYRQNEAFKREMEKMMRGVEELERQLTIKETRIQEMKTDYECAQSTISAVLGKRLNRTSTDKRALVLDNALKTIANYAKTPLTDLICEHNERVRVEREVQCVLTLVCEQVEQVEKTNKQTTTTTRSTHRKSNLVQLVYWTIVGLIISVLLKLILPSNDNLRTNE